VHRFSCCVAAIALALVACGGKDYADQRLCEDVYAELLVKVDQGLVTPAEFGEAVERLNADPDLDCRPFEIPEFEVTETLPQ